jgi:putative oxidoreductase
VSHQRVTSARDTTDFAWLDAAQVWLARFPLSIIQLAGRIGVGVTFFRAGLLKYQSWEFTVKLFQEEYRVPLLDPAVAARIAMVQELTIPILLFLGLATRIATLPLLGMIAVIQTFVYPDAYNEHLVWGAILVLLLTRGAGVFSLDYLIDRYAKQALPRRVIE